MKLIAILLCLGLVGCATTKFPQRDLLMEYIKSHHPYYQYIGNDEWAICAKLPKEIQTESSTSICEILSKEDMFKEIDRIWHENPIRFPVEIK